MLDTLLGVLAASWDILVDSGPWLLLGVVAAGLLKAFLPIQAVAAHLGGRGLRPIVKAALLGAPLPL